MEPKKLVPELYCSDIFKTTQFYTEVLGFRVLFERKEDAFVYLKRGDIEMMFEELGGVGRKWVTGELQKPFGRGINFQIEIENVEELFNQVLKLQKEYIYLELEEKWYRCDQELAGNKQFIVQDHDGYLLRFYENLGTNPI